MQNTRQNENRQRTVYVCSMMGPTSSSFLSSLLPADLPLRPLGVIKLDADVSPRNTCSGVCFLDRSKYDFKKNYNKNTKYTMSATYP